MLHEDSDSELPGKVRIKFETLAKRLNKIHVDIIHRQPDNYNLQENSQFHKDLRENDCLILQELERLRTLDLSKAVKE
jgi:hypothetical protein